MDALLHHISRPTSQSQSQPPSQHLNIMTPIETNGRKKCHNTRKMSHIAFGLLFVVIVLSFMPSHVTGHGRLIDPPARSTAWRYGFPTPVNWNDNELFCGGFTTQWQQNGGKCGICGDNWRGPRDHESKSCTVTDSIDMSLNVPFRGYSS